MSLQSAAATAAVNFFGFRETKKAITPDVPKGPVIKEEDPVVRAQQLDDAQAKAQRALLAAQGRNAAIGDRPSILGAKRVSTRRTLGGF